uniref:exostosin-1-like n=1 Tax=Ciona intestinalis TaxID=7719 RepID=UPI000180D291|nr:exostosin-1-like [Ciona intestinalis]|eukprot:XP_002128024.1 exostosin-1-like [Ciona intestinalis]
MQANKRYGLLLSSLILITVIYNGYKWAHQYEADHFANDESKLLQMEKRSLPFDKNADRTKHTALEMVPKQAVQNLLSYSEQDYYESNSEELVPSPTDRHASRTRIYKNRKCRMDTCFDLERCRRTGFKVYVYPDVGEKTSTNFQNILASLRASQYYTSDPEKACLFVPAYDTLDRDHLSADYIHNLGAKISRLKYWNNGKNHIIFNLYSGTWPEYLEDVGFNLGEAILAKASFGDNYYRHGFDISFPLIGKTHPHMQGTQGFLKANYFPPRRKYLLSFKGKRYTYGIGSSTRNALYHIHNGDDIIILTTCKHGKNWQSFSDQKCETDNEEYEKWDYQSLLHNSTFCMVPRGRRLGSFRFLESLQAACIPVVLANGWKLPFDEVIDWSKASLAWEERLLLQVPGILREVQDNRIMLLRQQSQFLWDKYFSSMDVIIRSTLEIIHDRVFPEQARPAFAWNSQPGALYFNSDTAPSSYPFYHGLLGVDAPMKFTAVIQATAPVTSSAAPIVKLLRNLVQSSSCNEIVVLWHCGKPPIPNDRWRVLVPQDGAHEIPIRVIDDQPKTMGRRFLPRQFTTDAILSLDDDVMLNSQEIDFAFDVWRSFPDRIVGFPARSHFWNSSKSKWVYTSKWSNSYSIVLTGAAFIHRYYLKLYSEWLPPSLRKTVDETSNCEDILMNMLVAHVTRLPPVKVTQKKQYKDTSASQPYVNHAGVVSRWSDPRHFAERQTCMQSFEAWFGYMPLISSETRFDPSLYKDNVSVTRKKYPKIEI